MNLLGRWLLALGLLLVVAGGLLLLAHRLPGIGSWLGHLPGDIRWERGNTRIYAPLGTMLLLSLVLTIVLNVLARLFR
ncbi:MAG: DUF2905 domain-containing protein [Bacteroidetes bacterium]|nr:hypothetical protein AWN76_011110 [Rhodothermaceae bacterium RA]RMH53300.1 MAG: DUF2905 domain-containing protein [Bacteroidota bacterium]